MLRSLTGSGGLLGPAPRRHFPASSCFSTKGNTFGVDFQLRRPPAKQQGPGSQRQPRPTLAYGDPRVGEKKASVALLSKGALGLWFVPRRDSSIQEYSSLHRVWIGALDVVSVLRSLAISAGLMGPTPRRHFPANSCLSKKEKTFGVGFQLRRPPAK